MAKEKLIVKHKCALGDTVVLTALLRDIELTYPGRFDLYVECNVREVMVGNPYAKIAKADDYENAQVVTINYQGGIARAGQGEKLHMLRAFYDDFNAKTNLDVKVTSPKPDLRLLDDNVKPIVEGDYWLIVAGSKIDVTIKQWRPAFWQKVVDGLRARGIRVVQAGATFQRCRNPTLGGVLDLVGKHHDARHLFNLVKYAKGVICPITAAMHIAAAFETPCVVIGGGREEPWWEGYTNDYRGAFGDETPKVKVPHAYLHTVGFMECCRHRGCWKHRVTRLHDNERYDADNKLCVMPTVDNVVAACMDKITPEIVLQTVDEIAGTTAPVVTPRSVSLPQIQKTEIEPPRDPDLSDHPLIGGKVTAFVLCYGDHPKLARSCLGSILGTIPRHRLDLRVALAAACPETQAYVRDVVKPDVVYDAPQNPGKYVLMRSMFKDANHPITTSHFVWFDDDTTIVDPTMWQQLFGTIVNNHPHGSRAYGSLMQHDLAVFRDHDARGWFRSAPWYRGRLLRERGSQAETHSGTVITFPVGYFWAMHSGLIEEADVPCHRLRHNGGDITIGAQLHQAGAKLKQFNLHKALVTCPTRENGGRRGMHHAFPWSEL